MNLPRTPKPNPLALFDKPIAEMQDILVDELSWLNYVFGKSQTLVKTKERSVYNYPGLHLSRGKYIDCLPSSRYGNFAFFVLDSTQQIEASPTVKKMKAKCSVIFWLNLSKIYTGVDSRNLEVVKSEILEVLSKRLHLRTGSFAVSEVHEGAKDIYKEYSLKEVDTQFLMQPYCGLRFTGTLTIKETC